MDNIRGLEFRVQCSNEAAKCGEIAMDTISRVLGF